MTKKKILMVDNDMPTIIDRIEADSLNNNYVQFDEPIQYHMRNVDNSYLDIGKSKKELNAKIVPVRTEPKIRRNILCPCGSNLKFKNCCLNKNL